jgi:hypothetical protein
MKATECLTLHKDEAERFSIRFKDVRIHTQADEDYPSFLEALTIFNKGAKKPLHPVIDFNLRATELLNTLSPENLAQLKQANIAFRFNIAQATKKRKAGWGHTDLFDHLGNKLCQGTSFGDLDTFLRNLAKTDEEKIEQMQRIVADLLPRKGFEGKLRSDRGLGPDFRKAESKNGYYALYNRDLSFGEVKIPITGVRSTDEKMSNLIKGLTNTPYNYTWHHLDDFDPVTRTCTMQLVEKRWHRVKHSGAVELWTALFGIRYR